MVANNVSRLPFAGDAPVPPPSPGAGFSVKPADLPPTNCANSMQDLRLPVRARKGKYTVERSASSPEVLLTCSAVQSATRVCASNSPTGKHMKWSKQRVTWRLALPALGDHEILLEVHRSWKGHRRLFINGLKILDTRNPLSKMSVSFELAGTHSFDFHECADGSITLFVDNVPFDELERCPTQDKTPRLPSRDKIHVEVMQSRFRRSIPGFGKFFSV